jgi:outer membrane phospholipase A
MDEDSVSMFLMGFMRDVSFDENQARRMLRAFMRKLLFVILICVWASVARAQYETLLVPPAEPVQAGKVMRVTLYLNNPTTIGATFRFPSQMNATFASPSEQRTQPVGSVDIAADQDIELLPMSFTKTTLTVMVPDTLAGNASLRIADPRTNPIMFVVIPAETVRLSPKTITNAEKASGDQPRDLSQSTAFDKVRQHLAPYDPIYFAFGAIDGANARFQFSFKFRVLTPVGNVSDVWHDMYFGYTQTSLWDLHSLSKPFYDTSYKPTVFFYRESLEHKPSWVDRLGLQIGVQHESNGQSVARSRSLNSFYFKPILGWNLPRGWQVAVAPRLNTYIDKNENPDIARYRGYVEWGLSAEHRTGLKFSAYVRKGTSSGYGSAELNASWSLDSLFPQLGGRVLLQYFNGWGESLLDYNKRRPDQVRLGLMLVP